MTIPETIAALRKARSRETHLYVTGAEPKLSSMSSEIPNVSKEDLSKLADLIEAVQYVLSNDLHCAGSESGCTGYESCGCPETYLEKFIKALEQTEPEKELK